MSQPARIDLIEGNHDLERDQDDDNELEAQRAARVDDVGKCLRSLRNNS
jgi:hypothetical protein